MILLSLLLAAGDPADSVELVLNQMEKLRDDLSAGQAHQRDRGTRETHLIAAVDEARLALYEATKALELVQSRLKETGQAVEKEQEAEEKARIREQAASEKARHALGFLVRGRRGFRERPLLRAMDRRRVNLTLEHLKAAEKERRQLSQVRARLASSLARQKQQQQRLQKLGENRKHLARAATSALARARQDEARAAAHSRALEANRLALAAWLEQLAPVLKAPLRSGRPQKGKMLVPVAGWLRHGYGLQEGDQGLSRWRNRGVDIKSPEGAPAAAASPGMVAFVGRSPGLGLVVVLDHGAGWRTVYGGLGEATVKTGDVLKMGAPLGRVGASGHLHFELRLEAKSVNPEAWFREPIPRAPQ
ncbi:MAG: hypothetical protein CMH55_08685 [Myxococcales bacterium]|nr:hypothetical protein [Myxococcales bacterium]